MILHTMNSLEALVYKTMLSNEQRIMLYEKIASFLDDGIDLYSILTKLGEKYLENGSTDPRAKILLEWAAGLSEGRSFSSVLTGWVPASEAMLIKSGEEAGEISKSIHNAILATSSVKQMIGTLKGELGYPAMLIIALMGMLAMISIKVMPELAATQDPSMWPSSAQGLYSLTEMVRTKWYWLFIDIFLIIFLVSFTMPRITGLPRKVLDIFQPWSTYRSVQSSIFMISIASQMKTGVPIVEAIESLEKMSNRYVSWHLREILLKLNGGTVIGKALNSGFMDKETGVDIEVFGDTSNLQDAMQSIGNRAIQNSLISIGKLAGFLRFLSIFSLAIFIGWTIMSIQSITSSIAGAAGI